jgi:biotin carboxyl carrier protein
LSVARDSGSPLARQPQDRLDDHATIDRLTDELLPALVAKLSANGLGELEVREGTWRVRLRMPADVHAAGGRRSPSGRQGARAADGPRGEYPRVDAAGTAGTGHATAASGHASEATPAAGPSRVVATSPAVGYFRPRADLRAGTKVRAGDRIGSVDVLGIGQDLVAPGDGLIGATLVAAGEPVEYGQAVIVLEQLAEPRPHAAGATAAESGPAGDGAPAPGVA